MKEKNNITAELLTYEGKKEECETTLKSYNYKSGNCNITANQTGYVSFGTEVREGGCQAKIIAGEKSVFRYLMEKINLLDK